MNKKYYIFNGEQVIGPFSINELLSQGVTTHTKLYTHDYGEWRNANEFPELNDFLNDQISPSLFSSLQDSNKMSKCPYCGELIKLEAIKCRYCGEWLNTPNQRQNELRPNFNYNRPVSEGHFLPHMNLWQQPQQIKYYKQNTLDRIFDDLSNNIKSLKFIKVICTILIVLSICSLLTNFIDTSSWSRSHGKITSIIKLYSLIEENAPWLIDLLQALGGALVILALFPIFKKYHIMSKLSLFLLCFFIMNFSICMADFAYSTLNYEAAELLAGFFGIITILSLIASGILGIKTALDMKRSSKPHLLSMSTAWIVCEIAFLLVAFILILDVFINIFITEDSDMTSLVGAIYDIIFVILWSFFLWFYSVEKNKNDLQDNYVEQNS